jgi:Zn-dependent M28 family amino/carboxypeptidase
VPARDWIKSQFDAIGGLQTSLYTFAMPGCAQPLMRDDVVAVLPSATHPSRVVVVGGHYDSRTLSVSDGTSPAPGANDSGSQTALVLELARVLAGHAFDATLVFVAFAGEEQGLVGSKALAANMASVVPGAQVVAMLNSDIVGGDNSVNDAASLQQFRLYSPGTPREVGATTPDGTPDDTSPSRGLMRYVATWGAAYVPSMTIVPKLREDRPGRGGDHESFIANSYPGVRFIETNESPNAGTTASHQHSPNDLFMYVTPDYTARVAQIVAAVAASLARAPDAPGSITGSGTAAAPMLTWAAPGTGTVDHYAVSARAVTENFYHARVSVPVGQTSASPSPGSLGVDPSSPYFLSVTAVDTAGHESLFAYPEYRCDPSGCVVPAAALNITATD